MNRELPYIDIHTHGPVRPGVISLRNIFLSDIDDFDNRGNQLLSVGLHPWNIQDDEDLNLVADHLNFSMGRHNVVAIGETGLDKAIKIPLEIQEPIFRIHAEVAESVGKPLVIHCVRSFQEILGIRRQMKAMQPWIFHGFHGSAQLARQCLNAGCLLSYGQAIMANHNRALHSLLQIDQDNFFLETDDSGLAIENIYERAAFLKQTSTECLRESIFERFSKLFGV